VLCCAVLCEQTEITGGIAEGTAVGQTRRGPISSVDLLGLLRGGELTAGGGHLLWCAGMVDWRPLGAALDAMPQLEAAAQEGEEGAAAAAASRA
jgi:hypothetical protein